MKYEPAIDRGLLLASVRDQFKIDAAEIEFIPVGYASACYRLTGAGGVDWFLKVWPDTAAGRDGAARQAVVLPLLRTLNELDLRIGVPKPLVTRSGRLAGSLDGLPLAVFDFIPGSTPAGWPDWPETEWENISRALAEIHSVTESVTSIPLARENFGIPFESDLRTGLDQAAAVSSGDRAELQALADFLVPRHDEILEQLERLHELHRKALSSEGPLVLCHTDFGGENLLIYDGRLCVLDWDEAVLAPPEADLRIGVEPYEGRIMKHFLDSYLSAGGVPLLRLERFGFVLLRRYLEDMTARLVRFLYEPTSAEEDRELIAGMQHEGFDQWRLLDERVAAIASAL